MPPMTAVSDTSLDADEAQLACSRRLTPQERLLRSAGWLEDVYLAAPG